MVTKRSGVIFLLPPGIKGLTFLFLARLLPSPIVMLYAIWYHLYNLKKVKFTCNFTNSMTLNEFYTSFLNCKNWTRAFHIHTLMTPKARTKLNPIFFGTTLQSLCYTLFLQLFYNSFKTLNNIFEELCNGTNKFWCRLPLLPWEWNR